MDRSMAGSARWTPYLSPGQHRDRPARASPTRFPGCRCSDRSRPGFWIANACKEARELEACNQRNRHGLVRVMTIAHRVHNAMVIASESGNPIGETKTEIMKVGNETIRSKTQIFQIRKIERLINNKTRVKFDLSLCPRTLIPDNRHTLIFKIK